jgi:hypothetical protein
MLRLYASRAAPGQGGASGVTDLDVTGPGD